MISRLVATGCLPPPGPEAASIHPRLRLAPAAEFDSPEDIRAVWLALRYAEKTSAQTSPRYVCSSQGIPHSALSTDAVSCIETLACVSKARRDNLPTRLEAWMTIANNRILIIDNDAHSVDAVASFLTARNFAVFRAETSREGLRLAQSERPDLIVMDIDIGPRAEGFATIRDIRRIAELNDVPIFIASASCANLPDFEIPHGGWKSCDLLIQKPVNLNQLLDQIRKRIEKAAQAAAQHIET